MPSSSRTLRPRSALSSRGESIYRLWDGFCSVHALPTMYNVKFGLGPTCSALVWLHCLTGSPRTRGGISTTCCRYENARDARFVNRQIPAYELKRRFSWFFTLSPNCQVMSQAGQYVQEDACSTLVVLISNTIELQGYAVRSMYRNLHAYQVGVSLQGVCRYTRGH